MALQPVYGGDPDYARHYQESQDRYIQEALRLYSLLDADTRRQSYVIQAMDDAVELLSDRANAVRSARDVWSTLARAYVQSFRGGGA